MSILKVCYVRFFSNRKTTARAITPDIPKPTRTKVVGNWSGVEVSVLVVLVVVVVVVSPTITSKVALTELSYISTTAIYR